MKPQLLFKYSAAFVAFFIGSISTLKSQCEGKIVSRTHDNRIVELQADYNMSLLDSIIWDFGDGSQSPAYYGPSNYHTFSSPIVSHTYAMSGNYTVTATVWAQTKDNLDHTGLTYISCQYIITQAITAYDLAPVPASPNSCGLTASISYVWSPPDYYTFVGGSWGTPISMSETKFYRTTSGSPVFMGYTSNSGSVPTSVDYNGKGSITFFTPGTYRVWYYTWLYSPADTCVDSTFVDFSIQNEASCHADFTMSEDSLHAGNWYAANNSTGTNISYYWSFGDGTYSTQPYPSHTYATPGHYDICLTIYGDSCVDVMCDTSSAHRMSSTAGLMSSFNVTAPTGIQQSAGTSFSLAVAPNPFEDHIAVRLSADKNKTIDLVLYDAIGRKILQQTAGCAAGENHFDMDTHELDKGLYSLVVSDDNGWSKMVKVIK
jgi:PKD repeat protein